MPLPPQRALTTATLLALALAVGQSPALAAAPSAANRASHQLAPAPLLQEAIAGLPVAAEDRTGYQRTSFRHWIDADGDGCSTRAEVLLEEAVTTPSIGPGCVLTGGSWHSYYDDTVVEAAAGLDVDHLVPLAEAWDSGASTWNSAEREAYANDLEAPHHLVAVTARSNRQKADKDPSQWLPPYEPARCRYIAEWTAVKLRWALTADPAEKATLTTLAQGCPNVPLPASTDEIAR
ncbi:HNH endonuclease family protein [Streptosporangium canum]|uniref:HNH endonuclease family protein n=1 Tax=Streptosporangium canum TaxID=324952 RepID=UPI0037BC5C41